MKIIAIYNIKGGVGKTATSVNLAYFSAMNGYKTLLIDTAKGFALNSLNPFVLVFWIGVITALNARQVASKSNLLLFFSAVLITVFSTDLLKAFLATRLKKIMTISVLTWLNRISGIALIFYGMKLIYDIL